MECAICGQPVENRPAVRLAQSKAHLQECTTCKSWTYFPRKTQAAQAAVHDDESYFAHPYFTLRRTITPQLRRRCGRIVQTIRSAAGIPTQGQRWLDIGCDTGAFLTVAKEELGIIPVGIDVAARSIAIAKSSGIEAYQTSIERAPQHLADFPVITAIDLIEHVPEPADFLREVRNRLRPGATLYLETPNIESRVYAAGRLLSKLTGGHPAAVLNRLFPPEHIQYFTQSSLASTARAAGLEVVQIRTRTLPWSDIAASIIIRLAMAPLQAVDRLTGRGILICAVLRKPPAAHREEL
jgi:2-polyprenyl-3-methyl-5-hydroxy-6-metoxy-1,4-benzoquinol methylase